MTARSPGLPTVLDQLFTSALSFHEKGEVERAEYLYREVLRQNPRHANALNMLGVIGCQSGNFHAGAVLISDALTIDPEHPDYNNNLGMALLEMGDVVGAISAFERAVLKKPRFPEAHFNLANAHRTAGEVARAEKHYRKALNARRDYPDAINNLANLLRDKGDTHEATQLLHKLVRLLPNFAPGYFNLALTLQAQARFDDAVDAYNRSLELDPSQTRAWEGLGECQRLRGALTQAGHVYAKALAVAAPTVSLLNQFGLTRFAQNRIAEARALFQQALDLDRSVAASSNHLGMTASATGDPDEAAAHFERALELMPTLGSAYRNLVELGSSYHNRAALKQRIIDALDLAGGDAERSEMEFALGNLCDAEGDYSGAFAAFERANALRRKRINFDALGQRRYIDAVRSVFSCDYFKNNVYRGDPSLLPVFIVGMPRSGTTLVEQILATHKQVFGAGELTFFAEHVATMQKRLSSNKPFPFCVPGRESDLASIASEYLNLLRERGAGASRIINKMPYNFIYLGLIAVLFPNARVIHCRREARATCFSIFTHDFVGSHPYSYDLKDLADAFSSYQHLMSHWRECLPLQMLEIDYESLLDDSEGESRRMVEFLGLTWDPACLEFYRNKRAVTSASQWQVRQPLYTTSSSHWRHYTQHLGPLINALKIPSEPEFDDHD